MAGISRQNSSVQPAVEVHYSFKTCMKQIPLCGLSFHGNIFSLIKNILAIFRHGVWAPVKQEVQVYNIIGKGIELESEPCGRCKVRPIKHGVRDERQAVIPYIYPKLTRYEPESKKFHPIHQQIMGMKFLKCIS